MRREMLKEAVEVMRTLWKGGERSYRGTFYAVEDARLYTLPETPPEIMVAAGAEQSAELAGSIGDGMIGTTPERELLAVFDRSGGSHKPRYGSYVAARFVRVGTYEEPLQDPHGRPRE
jgi:alkanesulfonate monooxygenase SsuD/methylene tetrahydromethanopterin reductase-like flavin-dependent oxidoreductase (luciferase family)